MVNRANPINGTHVDRHPFSDQEGGLAIYLRGTTVIAAQAQQSGVIRTAEGEVTFQPGDWIVTDNPPTHAWPIRQQVFAATYSLFQELSPGQYPTSEPHIPYEPDKSVPPPNAGQLKTDGVPEAAEATGNVGDRPPVDETALPSEPEAKPAKAPKTGRGIADSKSLGLDG